VPGIAWVNGKLLPPSEAAISPTDRGFLYGEGLFETMRAYDGRVFRLSQHLDRLIDAAAEIDFTPPGRAALSAAVAEALAAGDLSDAVVRLTVTPGRAGESSGPTVVVLIRPLSLPPAERYSSGCRAVCIPAAHIADAVLRRIKSLSYLDKLVAQRAASAKGADEAILLDPDGCVVEGAMRNVFAVISGELITPPVSRGFLPGITRQTILEVAQQQRMPCDEREMHVSALYDAEECFLTSSIAEILPVASVDGRALAQPAPGHVTARLSSAYRDLVARELQPPAEGG
jgi:D-amino acid aminotransferase